MTALPQKHYTVEEYFEIERGSASRHEYVNGDIYAMSGASPDHERIVSAVDTSLNNQLTASACEVFTSNLRLKVDDRKYYYADLSVVCGEAAFALEAGLKHLLNPTLVVEVLSPSTAEFDRGGKFIDYQSLDSLKEYVLISQDRPLIEVFTRHTGGKWLYLATQGVEASVVLESIGCTLTLSEVYRRVTFQPEG